jgi:hypothetical protein
MQKGLCILNSVFPAIGLYAFKDRKLSEDTAVGTVFVDSVKEDKQLGGKIKNTTSVDKDNSGIPT